MTRRVTNEVYEMIYLVNARLLPEKAHVHQIAQMRQALIEVGREASLWHPRRENTLDLAGVGRWDYYGLRCNISRRQLAVVDWHSMLRRFGKGARFIAHLLQSTAFYRTIIVSRLTAIMEVLRVGENAGLAEAGNPSSLTRAMERVMRDAPLVKFEMGES